MGRVVEFARETGIVMLSSYVRRRGQKFLVNPKGDEKIEVYVRLVYVADTLGMRQSILRIMKEAEDRNLFDKVMEGLKEAAKDCDNERTL